MKLTPLLFAACLLMTGCLFRNVRLTPGRDPMHRVISQETMLELGIPLKKANSMIGGNPVWFPTRKEATGLKQCWDCHKKAITKP